MPRLSRRAVFDQSPFLHILVQGIGKEFIFRSDEDKFRYYTLFEKHIKKHNLRVLAYCIMGNHAHFLITADDTNEISPCFSDINRDYAAYYNKKNNRVGYVFRDRFKSEPILGDDYLYSCILYIHNNPLEAGLVDKAEKYPYSSAKSYKLGLGIVDFELLKELDLEREFMTKADVSAAFLEDEYEGKMTLDEAITYAIGVLCKNNLEEIKVHGLLGEFSKVVQANTKVSLRTLAEHIGVSREYIRRKSE